MSKAEEKAPVGAILPGHVDPSLGLGDLLNYSGLLRQLITAFVGLSGTAVGGVVNLPPFETWLPVGGEWEIDMTATRKR